mgnify:CR=1 FL=1
MAELASRYWSFKSGDGAIAVNETLMQLSQRLFHLLDHVPARLTASGFAVVGNFEEAVNCWRRDASLWKYDNEGVILAAGGRRRRRAAWAAARRPGSPRTGPRRSTAGARPSRPTPRARHLARRRSSAHLRSVVGLVWRSVVLWMLLLALLWLAHLIG